ncbi:Renalase [Liparis tanakae]|uniref:Renalase n=1 Tax=Liparis tanakae TaxID=230148 RepID=A0A4Z2E8E6_9TELE|nr:Renalase [Liparis tanakae]
MGRVVKHFLSQSGAHLSFERRVTAVYRRGASWEVHGAGGSEMFDAVVLTMPAPQILQLQGDVVQSEAPSVRGHRVRSEVTA